MPVVAGRSSESAPQFFDLETREFGGEAAKALAGYLELARSTNRATAAVALQRAARVHRGRREWDAALAAYGRMAAFEDTWVDGMPADLLARRAFCDLLEEAGRARELAVAADALASDFQAGRWTLDRTAWDLTKGDIERWTGRSVSVGDDARAFTAAAETIWREWNEGRWLTLRGVRRRAITVNDLPVTVVERQDERGAVATVLLPEAVRAALLTLPPADPVTIGRMKALFFLV